MFFLFMVKEVLKILEHLKEQIYQATLRVFEYCLDSGETDIQGAFTSDLTLIKEILVNEFKLK